MIGVGNKDGLMIGVGNKEGLMIGVGNKEGLIIGVGKKDKCSFAGDKEVQVSLGGDPIFTRERGVAGGRNESNDRNESHDRNEIRNRNESHNRNNSGVGKNVLFSFHGDENEVQVSLSNRGKEVVVGGRNESHDRNGSHNRNESNESYNRNYSHNSRVGKKEGLICEAGKKEMCNFDGDKKEVGFLGDKDSLSHGWIVAKMNELCGRNVEISGIKNEASQTSGGNKKETYDQETDVCRHDSKLFGQTEDLVGQKDDQNDDRNNKDVREGLGDDKQVIYYDFDVRSRKFDSKGVKVNFDDRYRNGNTKDNSDARHHYVNNYRKGKGYIGNDGRRSTNFDDYRKFRGSNNIGRYDNVDDRNSKDCRISNDSSTNVEVDDSNKIRNTNKFLHAIDAIGDKNNNAFKISQLYDSTKGNIEKNMNMASDMCEITIPNAQNGNKENVDKMTSNKNFTNNNTSIKLKAFDDTVKIEITFDHNATDTTLASLKHNVNVNIDDNKAKVDKMHRIRKLLQAGRNSAQVVGKYVNFVDNLDSTTNKNYGNLENEKYNLKINFDNVKYNESNDHNKMKPTMPISNNSIITNEDFNNKTAIKGAKIPSYLKENVNYTLRQPKLQIEDNGKSNFDFNKHETVPTSVGILTKRHQRNLTIDKVFKSCDNEPKTLNTKPIDSYQNPKSTDSKEKHEGTSKNISRLDFLLNKFKYIKLQDEMNDSTAKISALPKENLESKEPSELIKESNETSKSDPKLDTTNITYSSIAKSNQMRTRYYNENLRNDSSKKLNIDCKELELFEGEHSQNPRDSAFNMQKSQRVNESPKSIYLKKMLELLNNTKGVT